MDVGHGVNSVLTHFRKSTERIGKLYTTTEGIGGMVPFDFLSFLVWPLLPTHCRCRGLLLHLITLNDTHTHIHKHTHTLGRPLDEGSARRNDLYLTTHNTHKNQTSMPPSGFEPAIPASERPQTYDALDRAATGIGLFDCPEHNQFQWKASHCKICEFPPVVSNCVGVFVVPIYTLDFSILYTVIRDRHISTFFDLLSLMVPNMVAVRTSDVGKILVPFSVWYWNVVG
jgi:hypothetical protein